MNYQDKLKDEKVEFDPQAWEAFQQLRNNRIRPAEVVPSNKRKRNALLLLLLLLLGSLLLSLGWTFYRQSTDKTAEQTTSGVLVPTATDNDSAQAPTTSTTTAPTSDGVDAFTANHQFSNQAEKKNAQSQGRTKAVSSASIPEELRQINQENKTTFVETSARESDKLETFTAAIAAPTDDVLSETPENAAEIARSKIAARSQNTVDFLPTLAAAVTTQGEEEQEEMLPPVVNAKGKPSRLRLNLQLGQGRTNWSNPLQSNFGYSRTRITGPHAQAQMLYAMNSILSVGMSGSYYEGKDQTVHRDNQTETEQRIALLAQIELQLIKHHRFKSGLVIGGGLERLDYSFAGINVDLNGNATRVLTPKIETAATFQLQLNTIYRLTRQQNVGFFLNTFSSNNGFLSYGLSYQINF
jgi:hypothetical protein